MDTKQLEKLEKYAQSIGLKGFVIGAKNEGLLTLRFQNMPINDAQEVMISGFLQVINMELEHHPEYSPAYRKLYTDLIENFKDLVRNSNKRFQEFHKKNGPQTGGTRTK